MAGVRASAVGPTAVMGVVMGGTGRVDGRQITPPLGWRPAARLWWVAGIVVVLGAALVVVPRAYSAFVATTTNVGNALTAAATFPTYPTSVTTDAPWAYHRSEDTAASAATSAAADSSGNSRPGTYAAMTNGPRLWWTFPEGAGTTTADLTGSDNGGTLTSGATWTTGVGGSGAVTATGAADTVYSDVQPIRADQSFTVSVWVYMTGSLLNTRAVASMTGAPGGTANPRSDWTLMFDPNSGTNRWAFVMAEDPTSGVNANYDTLRGTTTPVQNTWNHLVAVFDTSVAGGTMYLYVNGALEASTTHTALNNATSDALLTLGRRRNVAWGSYWNGSFGETRAYQRALSSTEVANLGKSTPETKWDFSEAAGSATTADSGVNGNTGTLGSATTFTAGHAGNAVTMSNSANGYVQGSRRAAVTDRSFSVAAWVNLNSLGAGASRAVLTQSGTTSSSFILKHDSGNKWAFAIPQDDVGTPGMDQILSTGAAATNSWVHLAGVYDDVANTIRLYVNGTSQGTTAHTDANEWNAPGAMQVGRVWWNSGWTDRWYGSVDSVRAYQRALSGAEVTNLAADTDPSAPFTEAGMTASLTGALQGTQQGQQSTTAVAFSGISNAYNNLQIASPGPTAFTVECWFRTSSTLGGVLIGFGSTTSGVSASYDRLLYLDSGDRLTFGTKPGASVLTIRSPAATTYNDGAWHHVAASLGAAGAKLYIDGANVISDAAITTAGSYAGYWRWGGDTLAGTWPNQPANDSVVGALDEVAIYGSQLSDQQIARHYYANH
jgi:hypothetical protein